MIDGEKGVTLFGVAHVGDFQGAPRAAAIAYANGERSDVRAPECVLTNSFDCVRTWADVDKILETVMEVKCAPAVDDGHVTSAVFAHG